MSIAAVVTGRTVLARGLDGVGVRHAASCASARSSDQCGRLSDRDEISGEPGDGGVCEWRSKFACCGVRSEHDVVGGALESFRELWGRVSSAADLDEDFAIDACEVEASIVRTVSGDSGAVDAFADAMDDLVLFWTSLRPERLVATAQTRQVAVRVNETGKAFGGEDVSGRTEDLEAVGVYEGEFSRHREIERRVEERVALMTPRRELERIGRTEADEAPLWVMGGVGGDDVAFGRRRLGVDCDDDESLDSCLSRWCGLSSGTCSIWCSGDLDGYKDGLTGVIPTELGLCTDLTKVYVYEISFVATCRRDLRSFFVCRRGRREYVMLVDERA